MYIICISIYNLHIILENTYYILHYLKNPTALCYFEVTLTKYYFVALETMKFLANVGYRPQPCYKCYACRHIKPGSHDFRRFLRQI